MSQIDVRTPTELMEIDAEDDNALRVIVVVPWELPGQWEQWRRLFAPGPVPITGGVGRTVFDGASRRLREPVRKRMLSAATMSTRTSHPYSSARRTGPATAPLLSRPLRGTFSESRP